MVDLFTGVTTLAFGVVAYLLSKNILITVLVTVAGALIARSLKPYVKYAWEKKHPPRNLVLFREDGVAKGVIQGAHVLVMTQGIYYDYETDEGCRKIDKLYKDAVAELRRDSPQFRFRYDLIKDRNYPIQICYVMAGKSATSVRLRYYDWMKKSLGNFKDSLEGRDSFSQDMDVYDEKGQLHAALVQVIFDNRLPASPADLKEK